MKPAVANWEAKTLCLRIEPISGDIVRLTRYPYDLTMSNGQVYKTFEGYEFSELQTNSDMSPTALDIQGILGVAGIERDQIAAGVYDNARCYLFATSWETPIEDEEEMDASIMGKSTLVDEKFIAEEVSLKDALNQSVGETYNVRCQKTFGEINTDRPIKHCGIDLAAITVTGTLTSVTSRLICRDSARIEVADYFAYGLLSFTTGDNAGLKPIEVKRYEADGTIELFEAMPYAMQVGDEYTLVPGCRKRATEDCFTKWNNIANYGGYVRIPTNAQAGKWGDK